MADLIQRPNGQAKDSSNAGSLGTINMFHASTGLNDLKKGEENKIALHPLYGVTTADDFLVIPVAPSDIMFNEDSDFKSINLINYGELNISMNRKLATWSITSFFPVVVNKIGYYDIKHHRGNAETLSKPKKYWFDITDRNEDAKDPYQYYCAKLLEWKNAQTPLVFRFDTWGTYYNCQIKKFEYGRKDAVGNVYYQLDFQEYKEYTKYDTGAKGTDYSSDTYYPGVGETILQVVKKLYGSSSESNLQYFMNLNGLTIPTIDAGVGYKVR